MKIRTVSLCLIRKNDLILVEETYDSAVNKTFYRPIGGTVEYGESSKLAVIREVKEEINAEITEPRLLFVIENLFTYLNQLGHEVDFIYEAELLDRTFYDKNEIEGKEGTERYKAIWKPVEDFIGNEEIKLVPDGLLQLLLQLDSSSVSNVKHISTR
ncbi:NUDIX hydrolase [Paenibacillus sp. 1P07SE]|uniref:NUDIX hydrolase n=1 Tax=Paenibacillus sp. 1P07SE TaxID=3132209 RepID=UPI0039A716CD